MSLTSSPVASAQAPLVLVLCFWRGARPEALAKRGPLVPRNLLETYDPASRYRSFFWASFPPLLHQPALLAVLGGARPFKKDRKMENRAGLFVYRRP